MEMTHDACHLKAKLYGRVGQLVTSLSIFMDRTDINLSFTNAQTVTHT